MDEARIHEIFSLCDHDGDGRLSRDELAEGLHRLNIPFSKQSLDSFLELVDVNHDGYLSFSEFHAAVLTQQERLKRAFKEIDHGGDARISAKDLERFAERLGWSLSHHEIKSLMAALDRAGRGHIDMATFCEFFLTQVGTGDAHAEGLFEAWVKAAPISALAVPDVPTQEAPSWVTLASGAVAGMVSRSATAPADRIKTMLQASGIRPSSSSGGRGSSGGHSAFTGSSGGSSGGAARPSGAVTHASAAHLASSSSSSSAGFAHAHAQPHNPQPRAVSGGGLVSAMSWQHRPAPMPAAAFSVQPQLAGFAPAAGTQYPLGHGLLGAARSLPSAVGLGFNSTAAGGNGGSAGALWHHGVWGPSHGAGAAEHPAPAAVCAGNGRSSAVATAGGSSSGAAGSNFMGRGSLAAPAAANWSHQYHAAAPSQAWCGNSNLGLAPDWEDKPQQQRQGHSNSNSNGNGNGKGGSRFGSVFGSATSAAGSSSRLSAPSVGSGSARITGVRSAARAILADGGLKGFWRGNGVNVLKVAPETAVRFWCYERTKRLLAEDPDNISMTERFLSGAVAGAVSCAVIYPLEVAKTRFCLASSGHYRSLAHCLASTLRSEGVGGLYRGLGASLLGIVPYSGVDLALFSLFKEAYHERWPSDEPRAGTLLLCGACSTTCAQIVSYPLQLVRTRLQAQGMAGRPVVYSGIADCALQTVRAEGLRGLYAGILPNFSEYCSSTSSGTEC